jgi:CysZ protein
MFASLGRAIGNVFDPRFFGTLVKAVVLTLALFIAAFIALQWGLHYLPTLHYPWVNAVVNFVSSVGLIVVMLFIGAPVVAAVYGTFFLDGVAKSVEAKYYASDAPASGATLATSLFTALRFTGLIVAVTVALLPADVFLPGVGSAATLVADGWLLGREYFELAALRHLPRAETDALRHRHRFAILGGGILLALLAYIPLADVIAPLFGAALMTHLFKFYQHRELAA